MYPKPVTPCRCDAAGICPRHRCEKTYEWVLSCRLNWHMFERWENGEGPCIERTGAMTNGSAPAEQFAELPACRHRGAEPIDHVECELCGRRSEIVPVFACAVLGKCTSRPYGTRTLAMRTMPACIRCHKYETDEIQLDAESTLNLPAS